MEFVCHEKLDQEYLRVPPNIILKNVQHLKVDSFHNDDTFLLSQIDMCPVLKIGKSIECKLLKKEKASVSHTRVGRVEGLRGRGLDQYNRRAAVSYNGQQGSLTMGRTYAITPPSSLEVPTRGIG